MRDCEVAVVPDYISGSEEASRVLVARFDGVANRILELARENHLHIHEDENLAELLAQVPVGQKIPEDAYQLVAELLLFLYPSDQELAEKLSRK